MNHIVMWLVGIRFRLYPFEKTSGHVKSIKWMSWFMVCLCSFLWSSGTYSECFVQTLTMLNFKWGKHMAFNFRKRSNLNLRNKGSVVYADAHWLRVRLPTYSSMLRLPPLFLHHFPVNKNLKIRNWNILCPLPVTMVTLLCEPGQEQIWNDEEAAVK